MRKAKKIKHCPNCGCEGSIVPSIARGFQKCIECKYIVAKRKVKRVHTVNFGLGNKTLDKAIDRLEELKAKYVSEDDIAKIQVTYGYGHSAEYKLVVEREESDEEVMTRMIREEKEVKARQERMEREKKRKKERALKLAEDRKRKQKQRDKVLEKERKKKQRLDEERKKLEDFFNKQGISIATVREVFGGRH